jgi:2-hydroxychromene-2-carboxylate isomerase
MAYSERVIARDPAALEELRSRGVMATPVVVIDDQTILGFDEPRSGDLLRAPSPAKQEP